MKYELSASLICGDPLDLRRELHAIERAGVDTIHFDVMDGHFVPRYGLYPEILKAAKKETKLPIELHMMVTDPEPYIPIFKEAGADMMYVHVEGNNNLHRTVKMIRDSGMKVGLVYNMATPFNGLDYLLPNIQGIMLMAINPGIVGHKIIPEIYPKLRDLKEKLAKYPDVKIMVDGGVTPQTSAEMVRMGATVLVCGTGSIFRPHEGTLQETTQRFREAVDKDLGTRM